MKDLISKMVQVAIDIYKFNDDERNTVFEIINSQIQSLNEMDKKYIEEILEHTFNDREKIFYYSCFINGGIEYKGFIDRIYDAMIRVDTDVLTRCMYETNILFMDKNISFEKHKRIHSMNVEVFYNMFKNLFCYTPICQREKKRIVICTEQIIGIQHAPTRIIMEMARTLILEMNYEVVICECPSNLALNGEDFYFSKIFASSISGNQIFQGEYKDVSIPIIHIDMATGGESNYAILLNNIKQLNPYFVLAMGVNNPIFDLIRYFTTLVGINHSTKLPIIDAQIVLKKQHSNMDGFDCLDASRQICKIIDLKAPIELEGVINYEKQKNKDFFLIAIVGNRLDVEIDLSFMKLMKAILNISTKISFVVIGSWKVRCDFFSNEDMERIKYIGYSNNLVETLSTMDVFLNPKRIGGGSSALMSLKAGTPVVTLSDCDVASHTGENFIVDSYDSMVKVIEKYFMDDEFYYSQVQNGLQIIQNYEKNDMKHYLSNLFEIIENSMKDEERDR